MIRRLFAYEMMKFSGSPSASRERYYDQFSKGKVKVGPVLLTEHQAMKMYWVSRGIAPFII
jgi:hypothetical protein